MKILVGETVNVIINHNGDEIVFGSVGKLKLCAMGIFNEYKNCLVENKLPLNEWSFVGLTVNSILNMSTIFVNDAFGFDGTSTSVNGRLKYLQLESYDWLPEILKGSVMIGADFNSSSGVEAFDGSISCLQIYDKALNPPTVSLKKTCPDIPVEYTHSQCSHDSYYYDGWCYKLSVREAGFAQAELMCMPDPNSPYESQLMFIENPKHWDYVAKLVADNYGSLSLWAGISDRDEDGFFASSFGENLTSFSPIFAQPGPQDAACGVFNKGEKG